MKLLLIRHADPDYANDSLTEDGHAEAQLLAGRLKNEKIDAIYVSPLGRAQLTAGYTLRVKNMTAETLDWLREFYTPDFLFPGDNTPVDRCWDWLPSDWTVDPLLYDPEHWGSQERMVRFHVHEEYTRVCDGVDALLARHGYVRDGKLYRAVRPNHDTVALFCHLGVSCVLLSHLWGVSPMPLWHGIAVAPSSVTVLNTEERQDGVAAFRAAAIGDISHLTAAGREPSFSARFCECFSDPTRHN